MAGGLYRSKAEGSRPTGSLRVRWLDQVDENLRGKSLDAKIGKKPM